MMMKYLFFNPEWMCSLQASAILFVVGKVITDLIVPEKLANSDNCGTQLCTDFPLELINLIILIPAQDRQTLCWLYSEIP